MTNIRESLDAMQQEALRLRFVDSDVTPNASAEELTGALLGARRRQDRVEVLYGNALRLRSVARGNSDIATAAADDAWDTAITANRGTYGEYSSAKERHADANLETLTVRRQARIATDALRTADEAVDLLRLTYWGLDGYRKDLLSMLRTPQFESHLER